MTRRSRMMVNDGSIIIRVDDYREARFWHRVAWFRELTDVDGPMLLKKLMAEKEEKEVAA